MLTERNVGGLVQALCDRCGGTRNHIVKAIEIVEREYDYPAQGETIYQIVMCLGCNTRRFRLKEWALERNAPDEEDDAWESVAIYPSVDAGKRVPRDFSLRLPEKIAQMYVETISAFNSEAYTLCGAGLRAIVEALCLHEKVEGKNLQKKIDELVVQRKLTAPQAELLHEERYLGNAALHEIEAPDKEDLEDGLQIVEGLLHTIYVLPAHAERMKQKRAKKEAKKPVPKEDIES
jgi:hypothetical protein